MSILPVRVGTRMKVGVLDHILQIKSGTSGVCFCAITTTYLPIKKHIPFTVVHEILFTFSRSKIILQKWFYTHVNHSLQAPVTKYSNGLRATQDFLSPWSSTSTSGRGIFHLQNSVDGTTANRSDTLCSNDSDPKNVPPEVHSRPGY